MRRLTLLFLSLFAFALPAQPGADGPVTTVILVRHAEKATTPGEDPPLTAAGEQRAQTLARMLANVPVTAIYTTPWARTRATAAPLAKIANVQPQEVPTGQAYPAEIVRRILEQRGGTFVVVGHSNTTRNVLRAFGIADAKEIADSEYDNLYILTIAPAAQPRVLSLKY
jgi:broad specificity phosphatase PhoE